VQVIKNKSEGVWNLRDFVDQANHQSLDRRRLRGLECRQGSLSHISVDHLQRGNQSRDQYELALPPGTQPLDQTWARHQLGPDQRNIQLCGQERRGHGIGILRGK
jgi:hypothetical protein